MLLIDGFLIDAEITSDHVFENDVTDHPVEVGADITDNSRARPVLLTLEGVVSDTPLGAAAVERTGVTLPSADALARLTGIRNAREPISIATSLQRYDNMLMQRLSITKNADTGRALRFVAEFKQVILATNERVVKRTVKPSVRVKIDRGAKATTPVTNTPPKVPQVDATKAPVRRVATAVGHAPPGNAQVKRIPDFYSIGGGAGRSRF